MPSSILSLFPSSLLTMSKSRNISPWTELPQDQDPEYGFVFSQSSSPNNDPKTSPVIRIISNESIRSISSFELNLELPKIEDIIAKNQLLPSKNKKPSNIDLSQFAESSDSEILDCFNNYPTTSTTSNANNISEFSSLFKDNFKTLFSSSLTNHPIQTPDTSNTHNSNDKSLFRKLVPKKSNKISLRPAKSNLTDTRTGRISSLGLKNKDSSKTLFQRIVSPSAPLTQNTPTEEIATFTNSNNGKPMLIKNARKFDIQKIIGRMTYYPDLKAWKGNPEEEAIFDEKLDQEISKINYKQTKANKETEKTNKTSKLKKYGLNLLGINKRIKNTKSHEKESRSVSNPILYSESIRWNPNLLRPTNSSKNTNPTTKNNEYDPFSNIQDLEVTPPNHEIENKSLFVPTPEEIDSWKCSETTYLNSISTWFPKSPSSPLPKKMKLEPNNQPSYHYN
ncbi:hypothetical protein BB559_002750 [Furculomyces boomerangus]|uniref:Uncharacterized protein n=1 Tax=Furculomyces boomerangus TaxID=61424 RepID=A0A2T9YSX1_9FUNG|nr:hypothetical protein BB559_002750 [Furculomyces boomerangus]